MGFFVENWSVLLVSKNAPFFEIGGPTTAPLILCTANKGSL